MVINDELKIVIPIGDGAKAYHLPISRDVFELNYKLLAAVKSELAGKGVHYQMMSGPVIAKLALLDEARKESASNGNIKPDGSPDDSMARSFISEIARLTTIIAPSSNGFDIVPVETAINSGRLDKDDWDEALSSLIFFTCHFAMASKRDKKAVADATASLLSASITSLSCSEYVSSLRKSTTEEDLKATPSSVPL
ncbi:MAG: hypothetical protein B7Y55_01095 [Polynucleobacter sp. 35-46-207]|nr:MAG: hypothetical protein B7Y55_01095 [Polynucleobacter sp. 35-46-207]OZB49407.1 MAG: hypothetical protein B7X60_01205 [Polynucleobacter sp. 39-45-136]